MARERIAEHKKARFDVAVDETIEAGLILTGDEIKSIRAHRAQLTGAYVRPLKGVMWLINMHLGTAKDATRSRQLLLHQKELDWLARVAKDGKQIVPLDLVLRGRWAKVVIGVGKSRKNHDKRALLKERAITKDAQQALRG